MLGIFSFFFVQSERNSINGIAHKLEYHFTDHILLCESGKTDSREKRENPFTQFIFKPEVRQDKTAILLGKVGSFKHLKITKI